MAAAGGAWIVPPVIGRRKLVWLERPWARLPVGVTAHQVAIEADRLRDRRRTRRRGRARRAASSAQHGDLRADVLVVGLEHLEAVVGVEAGEGAEGLSSSERREPGASFCELGGSGRARRC